MLHIVCLSLYSGSNAPRPVSPSFVRTVFVVCWMYHAQKSLNPLRGSGIVWRCILLFTILYGWCKIVKSVTRLSSTLTNHWIETSRLLIFGLITGTPRNSDLPKKAVERFVHFGKDVTNKSKMARADIAAIADIHLQKLTFCTWK